MPNDLIKPICKPHSRCKKEPLIPPPIEIERRCYNIVAKPEHVCTPKTCVDQIIPKEPSIPAESEGGEVPPVTGDSELPKQFEVICTEKFNISCLPTKPISSLERLAREQRERERVSQDRGVGTDEFTYDEFGNRLDKYDNIIPGDHRGMCPCCKCDPCTCGSKYTEDYISALTRTAGDLQATQGRKLGEKEDVSCTCLPGLCICPGGGGKKKKQEEEVKKEKLRLRAEGKGSDVSLPSCLCLHHEDRHYISPATTAHSIQTEPQPVSRESIVCTCPRYQRTLAIIKPNAMVYKDAVIRAITQEGLDIVNERTIHLTPEQVAEIYEKQYGTLVFPINVVNMSIGAVAVLALAGIDAIRRWNNMVGPERVLPQEWFFPASMRRLFSLPGEIADAVHASEDLEMAQNENRYFFSHSVLEPILMERPKVEDYFKVYLYPTLSNGLTTIAKLKPRDPILYLAAYLLTHNPYRPNMPKPTALTPT